MCRSMCVGLRDYSPLEKLASFIFVGVTAVCYDEQDLYHIRYCNANSLDFARAPVRSDTIRFDPHLQLVDALVQKIHVRLKFRVFSAV
jgi:hypothetical protein